MPLITVSAQAALDAYGIWNYTADDNLLAADKWAKSFDKTYQMLVTHPRLGPSRPDLGEGLRYFPSGSYAVFCSEIADGIHILRIFHGARNLDALFQGEEKA